MRYSNLFTVALLWPSLAGALLASPAQAQLAQTGAGGNAGGGAPAYTGPGDVVSGATAFYGLRAYTAAIAAAHTQELVNIRNTATSETCDVIVATNGGFGNVANCSGSSNGDTVAVFCAESAGSCAVTKAYDQTGNGSDISQATAASQPTLTVSCLNSLPCFSTSNGQQNLAGTITSISQPLTFSAVTERTGTTTVDSNVINTTNIALLFTTSANVIGLYAGSIAPTETATANSWHAISGVIQSGSLSILNVDGADSSTGNSGGLTTGTAISFAGGTSNFTGSATELGLWPIAFSSAQRTNMCHNQYTYWGTSTPC